MSSVSKELYFLSRDMKLWEFLYNKKFSNCIFEEDLINKDLTIIKTTEIITSTGLYSCEICCNNVLKAIKYWKCCFTSCRSHNWLGLFKVDDYLIFIMSIFIYHYYDYYH